MLDLGVGGGIPVSLMLEVGVDTVEGVSSKRIRGPLVVTDWMLRTPMGESSVAQWNLFRVDFSPNPGLQTFTFVNNGVPLTGFPDGITLNYEAMLFDDTAVSGVTDTFGWSKILGVAGTFDIYGPMRTRLVIPYTDVFVKFYMQNDTAALRLNTLSLTLQRLADGGEIGDRPIPVRARTRRA